MPHPWEELARLCEDGEPVSLQRYVDGLDARDVAMSVSRMPEASRIRLATLLEPEETAELIEQLPAVEAAAVIEALQPEVAAAIIDNLPSDEQADLLHDLDPDDADEIIARMHPDEARSAKRLTAYADDVAGGLMVTEFLQYPQRFTVDEVVRDLRRRASDYRDYDVQYAYVTDGKRRLIGVLRMRDLLLADDRARLDTIMIESPVSITDEAPIREVADLFRRHDYLGVPVTDRVGRMQGVVRRDAVDQALGERNDSDYLKAQGIVGGEEIRTMPLLTRSRRRLTWLSLNIVLNVLAASVIAMFQDTLSSVIALAVFLPIISDMSGCSGNQAVAVSMRELSLGLVRSREVLRVWMKEASVGLINGVVLGSLIAVVAILWQGNPYLGLVVGLSLCLNTLLAVSLGGVVPLVLKRFGVDPAVASGPILTTLTDMCGFLLVLGMATMFLDRLTH